MIKLYTEKFGHGPNIVLLHGWGMHSGIWTLVARNLSEQFTVTLVDLPGFGRSESISEYTLENIIAQLLLVTPSEAVWLGWSLGGLIATRFALAYPSQVKKLICVASTPKFIGEDNWPGVKLSALQKFNEQLQVDYKATLKRFLLLQFHGMPLNKELIQWLNFNLFLYGKPTHHTFNGSLKILETEDLRSEIANLSCPILYILGKLDTLVPAELSKILKRINADIHTVVFPKASHALFLSHQNEFLIEIRRFIYEEFPIYLDS